MKTEGEGRKICLEVREWSSDDMISKERKERR